METCSSIKVNNEIRAERAANAPNIFLPVDLTDCGLYVEQQELSGSELELYRWLVCEEYTCDGVLLLQNWIPLPRFCMQQLGS